VMVVVHDAGIAHSTVASTRRAPYMTSGTVFHRNTGRFVGVSREFIEFSREFAEFTEFAEFALVSIRVTNLARVIRFAPSPLSVISTRKQYCIKILFRDKVQLMVHNPRWKVEVT
jgi:hypothetical protein